MEEQKRFVDNMLSFINQSPSQFHAVQQACRKLSESGFKQVFNDEKWDLQPGGKYFLCNHGVQIFAFIMPESFEQDVLKFKMIGSHTDSPVLKIKPDAAMDVEDVMVKINTEVYGGPILYTWFDRPLSIAGRVAVCVDDKIQMKLIDFQKPVAVLPSVAIHLNREVNEKGLCISNQKELLPIVSFSEMQKFDKKVLLNEIAGKIGVNTDDILDYELNFYDATPGCTVGVNDDFVSSARLDNLSMFYSSIEALCNSCAGDEILIAAGFNHEEVGSGTSTGAASGFVPAFIERLYQEIGLSRVDFLRSCNSSFILSADLSHAYHPNYPDKTDPVLKNMINAGPVIKYNYSQSYATDTQSASQIVLLCKKNNLDYQKNVNHSDVRGGSTIGPKISSLLGCCCVDIGVGVLAMHSIREFGGSKDFYQMYNLMNAFFK
jgi:aspartyl aminopeptidase